MKYSINNSANKYELFMTQFVTIALYLPAVKFCIFQSIPGLSNYNGIANIVIGILLVLLFFRQTRVIIKRSSLFLFLNIIILSLSLLSASVSGDNNLDNYVLAIPDMILLSSFLFLTVISINNYDYLYEYLAKYSKIVILFSVFMIVCTSTIGVVGAAESTYNMSLSYYVLVPTMMSYLEYKNTNKKSNLIYSLLGIFVVLIMGSRGPLLCLFIFVVIFTMKNIKYTNRNIIVLVLGICFFIFIFINYQSIVETLYSFLLSKNIDSRTLFKIISGKLFDDSNRLLIIENILTIIQKNPLGIGFMGDLSCHNILIENFLWFGIFVGLILNICIILSTVLVLLKNISLSSKSSVLLLVFFSYAIPDALLNLTIWGKDMFWIFLAILISGKVKSRIKIKSF